MQKIISDTLPFYASGKKQLAIQDIEQAVKDRDLSFKDFKEINDHHYCYDIKAGEKKLREVQIDEVDEYYRLYYLPEKSTTGIKVYIHEPAHDHLKTMVKVIFPKLCAEYDCS